MLTKEEALARLKKAGLKNFNDQKLRYRLREGRIKGIKPPKNSPRTGWLIDEQSLEDYIVHTESQVIRQLQEKIAQLEAANGSQTFDIDEARSILNKEAARLGISYAPILRDVERILTEVFDRNPQDAYRRLLELAVSELLIGRVRELVNATENEHDELLEQYMKKDVPELVKDMKRLREKAGGTPTTGTASVEYVKLQQALAKKGIPIKYADV